MYRYSVPAGFFDIRNVDSSVLHFWLRLSSRFMQAIDYDLEVRILHATHLIRASYALDPALMPEDLIADSQYAEDLLNDHGRPLPLLQGVWVAAYNHRQPFPQNAQEPYQQQTRRQSIEAQRLVMPQTPVQFNNLARHHATQWQDSQYGQSSGAVAQHGMQTQSFQPQRFSEYTSSSFPSVQSAIPPIHSQSRFAQPLSIPFQMQAGIAAGHGIPQFYNNGVNAMAHAMQNSQQGLWQPATRSRDLRPPQRSSRPEDRHPKSLSPRDRPSETRDRDTDLTILGIPAQGLARMVQRPAQQQQFPRPPATPAYSDQAPAPTDLAANQPFPQNNSAVTEFLQQNPFQMQLQMQRPVGSGLTLLGVTTVLQHCPVCHHETFINIQQEAGHSCTEQCAECGQAYPERALAGALQKWPGQIKVDWSLRQRSGRRDVAAGPAPPDGLAGPSAQDDWQDGSPAEASGTRSYRKRGARGRKAGATRGNSTSGPNVPPQASEVQRETGDGVAMTAEVTAVTEPSHQKNELQTGRDEDAGQDEAPARATTTEQDKTGVPDGEQAGGEGAIGAGTSA